MPHGDGASVAERSRRDTRGAREALLDHVAVDPARVHVIPASDGAWGDDIDAAMREYRRLVCHNTVFDVHLLGMGGEGHMGEGHMGEGEGHMEGMEHRAMVLCLYNKQTGAASVAELHHK